MDTNGGNRTRLTTDPSFDVAPGWTADGKRITYAHFDQGVGYHLRIVDAAGGNDHPAGIGPGAFYAEPQPPADADGDGIRDDWETSPARRRRQRHG